MHSIAVSRATCFLCPFSFFPFSTSSPHLVPERLLLDFQFFKKLKGAEKCPLSDKFVRERTFAKSETWLAAILNKS
jgi:hypothetical protein